MPRSLIMLWQRRRDRCLAGPPGPLSIKKAAQRLAKEDGVSLNQWIAVAVAEKVGVVETAADFFKKRAGKATGSGLMKFLRNAPDVPPEPEDAVR